MLPDDKRLFTRHWLSFKRLEPNMETWEFSLWLRAMWEAFAVSKGVLTKPRIDVFWSWVDFLLFTEPFSGYTLQSLHDAFDDWLERLT